MYTIHLKNLDIFEVSEEVKNEDRIIVVNLNRLQGRKLVRNMPKITTHKSTAMNKKEVFHPIEIKYACVCNTKQERDLFVKFLAAMVKLKAKKPISPTPTKQ